MADVGMADAGMARAPLLFTPALAMWFADVAKDHGMRISRRIR
jgi:hypothetical protein